MTVAVLGFVAIHFDNGRQSVTYRFIIEELIIDWLLTAS